jgi:hypothetical protein
VLATTPAIWHAHDHFLAAGAAAHGEVAAGDHLQTTYRLWLPGHQLEHGRAPWRDPYSFRPEASAQLNPAAWPYGLPFWPLWRAFGLVVGWNVFVLLTLAAAGLLTFVWLRQLELATGAALAGGLVFELAPYRLEQSTEHLLGPISLLLPLSLWSFERGRDGPRWWLLLSAAAIASIPLSGQVHLAMGAIPFYLGYAYVRARRDRGALTAALAATALAVAAAVLLWIFVINGSIGEGGRSLDQVRFYSADWLDFVTRHVRHGTESFVFLGWLTPLAAAAGLAILLRERIYGLASVLGLGAAVPILLALGTTTPLYEAVRFVVWPLRYPRVPERLLPIACLAMAALVAFALDWLLRAELRERRFAAGLAVLAIAVLVLDVRVTTFRPTAADEHNLAYAALRSEPPGLVLEVPVFRPGIHYGGAYLYYGTQAQRQRPQGYSTVAPVAADRVAKDLAAINCGDWPAGTEARLRRLGVGPIVFHAGLYRNNPAAPDAGAFAWRGLIQHGYRPVIGAGAVTLMARGRGEPGADPLAEPPRDAAVFCDGWRPNDGAGRALARPHASLWAYNTAGADLRLYLRSEHPGTVRIGVDGQTVDQYDVSSLAEARIPLGREGWHLVTFDLGTATRPGPHGVRVVAYTLR